LRIDEYLRKKRQKKDLYLKNMRIISISGLDGSGKSTQIQRLKKYLEQKKCKVFYFHAIKFSLAKKIIEIRNRYCLICRLSGKCKTQKEKSVTRANLFQIKLREIFLKIDLWRFKNLVKKLKKEKFDYILSDRYFYDSFINILFLNLNLNLKNYPETKLKIIKPELAIYLQTDPAVIMSRKRKPEQGIDYLKKKKELYANKILKWNLKIINGNQDEGKVFQEIKNSLFKNQ